MHRVWQRFAGRCRSLWLSLSYRVEECVGALGVECLVAVHHGHKVFGIGEVDDVVSVSREHYHRLYAVAGDFVFPDLAGSFLAHLYESVPFHYDELFPLGVVPVLSLCYSGTGYVHAHLAAGWSVDQFGE